MAKIKVGKGTAQGTAQSVPTAALTNSSAFLSNSSPTTTSPTTIVSGIVPGSISKDQISKPRQIPSDKKSDSHLIAEILSVLFKGGSLAGVLCLALLLGERAFRQQAEAPINTENLPFVSLAADYGNEAGDTDDADSESSRFSGPISGPIFSGVTKIFSFASAPITNSISEAVTPIRLDPAAEQAAEAKVLADSRNRTAMSFIAGLIAAHRPSITNCEEVAKHIMELSRYYKTDPFFVAAVISVESRFGETAKSKAGAVGLMQLLPQTAAEVAYLKTGTQGRPKLTDGRTNIALGIAYLMNLQKQFDGDRFATLAAYNWGPKNVIDVNRVPERFPKDVRKYASTVIERAEQWKRHFQKTEQTSAQMTKAPVNS